MTHWLLVNNVPLVLTHIYTNTHTHTHGHVRTEQGSKEQDASGQQRVDEKVFSDDELVSLIDPILQMDDISRDGYIDYPEFIKAQQKAAANQQEQQEQDHQED
jgi:hypothetical protein